MSTSPPGRGDARPRLEDVFHSAADLSPDARSAFLAEACREDRELRDRVEALLEAEEQGRDRLQPPHAPARAAGGDDAALDRLRSHVFGELERGAPVPCADRRDFFRAAGKAMQRILVDRRRERDALRRGGAKPEEPPNDATLPEERDLIEAMAISEVLDRLEGIDERKAEIVRLRYLIGLTSDETAEALAISPRLVRCEWTFARAWIHRELSEGDAGVRGRDVP